MADDLPPDAWGHGDCHRVTESVIEDRDEDEAGVRNRVLIVSSVPGVVTAHWAGHQDMRHRAIHHQQYCQAQVQVQVRVKVQYFKEPKVV